MLTRGMKIVLPLRICICLKLDHKDKRKVQELSFFSGPSFQEHLFPKQIFETIILKNKNYVKNWSNLKPWSRWRPFVNLEAGSQIVRTRSDCYKLAKFDKIYLSLKIVFCSKVLEFNISVEIIYFEGLARIFLADRRKFDSLPRSSNTSNSW